MNKEYEMLVHQLMKNPYTLAEQINPRDLHLIHCAMGIAGEAGEILDSIKKQVVYRKREDKAHLIEELGDLEFYMQGLRSALNVTRDHVLKNNMAKLKLRYGNQYSDQSAKQRNDEK